VTLACSDCGTLQDLPPLQDGAAALCPTCANWLERTSGRSIAAALACSISTWVLLIPACTLPLMSVSLLGVTLDSRLWSSVADLWNAQWVIVAAVVALFVIALPFVRFGLLTIVLTLISLGRRASWLGRAFRWSLRLDAWSMPDVFLIGFAIGYTRVETSMAVTIEAGGLCLIAAAMLCMLSRAVLDKRTVWRAIAHENPAPPAGHGAVSCEVCELVVPESDEGTACPRCGLTLTARRPDAVIRTTALLIGALALYFPANLYPMSIAMQAGREVPHRIIDGVRELYEAGLWPLGIIIFCTSIAIPMLKVVGLGWLLLSIHRRSATRLALKTRFYRLIDEIGRWSTVDVFTIAVFVPLMRFGALASAHSAWGATAFVLVVILTMLASRTFDPRMLWDAGEESSHD
jgi:paraquat-inducible protein A